jgi:Type IV secretion system pilin
MKNIINKIILTLSVVAATFATIAPLAYAASFDNNIDESCKALTTLNGGTDCSSESSSIQKLLKTVLNILSFVVGFIAVIMIIIAGVKYVTSQGDSNAIGAAKNTIIYAVVGLVVVAFAQAIVQFTLKSVK